MAHVLGLSDALASLLEVVGDIADQVVLNDFGVGLVLVEVDQLRERDVRLVLAHFFNLLSQLSAVAVVGLDNREILGIQVRVRT